jgi:Raf kinase inhibitor-like YbhB/YbcL family protein
MLNKAFVRGSGISNGSWRKNDRQGPAPNAAPRLLPYAVLFASLFILPVGWGNLPALGGGAMPFSLKTTAFSEAGSIPKTYTCDGADISPELKWSDAPAGTQSFALIADDPDAPVGTWTHWLLWNIPAGTVLLPEGLPKNETLSDGARQGRNDFKRIGYGGPCPPPGKPHRYFFKLYAVSNKLELKAGAGRNELERAMKGNVLAQAEMMGRYGR